MEKTVVEYQAESFGFSGLQVSRENIDFLYTILVLTDFNDDTQNAKRALRFESFPSVLRLQLRICEYDIHKEINVKVINLYVTFDEIQFSTIFLPILIILD